MRRKKDLVRVQQSPAEIAADLLELRERARKQVEVASSENTRVAYAIDMGQFEQWCSERGAQHLPCTENVLSAYMAQLERLGLKPSSIDRKLAAIVRYHRAGGHGSPRSALISEQIKGIKRGAPGKRPRPVKQAPPLTIPELTQVIDAMDQAPPNLRSLVLRDRAALLVGWSCAMRRGEIVGLEIDDVEHVREGWKVWIRRSKTDQDNTGVALALAPAERNKRLCPVEALETWLVARQGGADVQPPGGLFWKSDGLTARGTHHLIPGDRMPWVQINHLITRWCKQAKLVSSSGQSYSPHSLRAGFITESIQSGRSVAHTKERSRHVSMDQFFKYVRIAMTFENNAQKGLL